MCSKLAFRIVNALFFALYFRFYLQTVENNPIVLCAATTSETLLTAYFVLLRVASFTLTVELSSSPFLFKVVYYVGGVARCPSPSSSLTDYSQAT